MAIVLPDIQIGNRMSPRPSEEERAYFQQMGIEYAILWTTIEDADYAFQGT